MVYGLFINFFNTFCSAGGVEAVLDIISPGRLSLKAGDIVTKQGYKLPLEMVAMLVAPFKSVKSIARPEVVKPLVEAGKDTFLQRIQNIDAKDIKDINKEQISGSMLAIKDLLKLQFSDEEASKIVETHEMLLSRKFIQSPYLEKRLQGVGDIRKLIEKTEPASTSQRHIVQASLQQSNLWFTGDYLAKWIISNKILEVIFNENVHSELVKKSKNILIFLARKDMVTAEIIELVWKSQIDKHEDIVRAVYDTIRDVLEHLSTDVNRAFNNKIP